MSYDTSPEDQAKTAARYAAEVKHCEEVARNKDLWPTKPDGGTTWLADLIRHERSEAIASELLHIVEEWNEDKARLAQYMSPEQVAQACAAARDAALEEAARDCATYGDEWIAPGATLALNLEANRIRALKVTP